MENIRKRTDTNAETRNFFSCCVHKRQMLSSTIYIRFIDVAADWMGMDHCGQQALSRINDSFSGMRAYLTIYIYFCNFSTLWRFPVELLQWISIKASQTACGLRQPHCITDYFVHMASVHATKAPCRIFSFRNLSQAHTKLQWLCIFTQNACT